jgi:hypothetical protein
MVPPQEQIAGVTHRKVVEMGPDGHPRIVLIPESDDDQIPRVRILSAFDIFCIVTFWTVFQLETALVVLHLAGHKFGGQKLAAEVFLLLSALSIWLFYQFVAKHQLKRLKKGNVKLIERRWQDRLMLLYFGFSITAWCIGLPIFFAMTQ